MLFTGFKINEYMLTDDKLSNGMYYEHLMLIFCWIKRSWNYRVLERQWYVQKQCAKEWKQSSVIFVITGITSVVTLLIIKQESLKKSDQSATTHFCKICREEIFPFQALSNDEYVTSIVKNININENLNLKNNPNNLIQFLMWLGVEATHLK